MTDTLEASATAATLIIGQPVRAGRGDEYAAWHRKVEVAAAQYPGYLSSEVKRPTDMQPDWISVYRFDSVTHVQGWLNSATRQNFLDQAEQLFDGPATQQVIAREKQLDDALVTVVVTHRVPAGQGDAFLEWQKEVLEKESKYPGFRGSEVFRPIEGVQDDWVISYKFDTAEHLDAWLVSEDRRELLKDPRFGDFKLRKIDHSFGNWFAFGNGTQPPPSNFKTSIAVWMGLYPTVVFLSLLTAPLGMPLWLGMLVGNLLSSFTMTYLTMPYYGNPILKWWLKPSPDTRQRSTNIRGLMLVLAINAAWALVFYLVTVKFWSLP